MVLNIPGGEFLTGSLDVISQSLTIPVLIILLVIVIISIITLGGAIAEYKADKEETPRLVRIGVEDNFGKLGDLRFCWEQHGLTAPQIAERIKKELK